MLSANNPDALIPADGGVRQVCPGPYIGSQLIDHVVLDPEAASRRAGIGWREVPVRAGVQLSDHCPSLLEITAPRLPLELQWQRTSAEYAALVVQTYRDAGAALSRHIRRGFRWPFSATARRPWAVALDIDETILDNSHYEVERLGQGYDDASWRNWVERGQAGLIAPAARFVRGALATSDRARVVLVTNQRQEQISAVRTRLVALDSIFADQRVCVIGRTDASDKNPRWAAVEAGVASCGQNDTPRFSFGAPEIELWIGDNIEDFPCLTQASYHGDADLPASCTPFATKPWMAAGPRTMIGDRFFVLPNPIYGSWQPRERRKNDAPTEIGETQLR